MNRMTRNVMAGALAATVALGMAAPAAVAAPKAAHTKVDHKSAKAHKHVKTQRVTKSDRRLTAEQRRVAKTATIKVRHLERVAGWNKLVRLADTAARDAVLANIGGDVAELEGLKAGAAGATLEALTGLRAEVRKLRPEVYYTVVNDLRWAGRLDAALTAATAADPALAAELDAAAAKVDAVVDMLMTYDADTTRAELRAAKRALTSVAITLAADDEEESPEESPEEAPETETPDSDAGVS